MNQGMAPGLGAQPPSSRPGRMTAVMRAVQPSAGPKVLRIGLVVAGRILEERVLKRRTSVTVGASERSTFVVQEILPSTFKLFELVGGEYCLNFVDGMGGRLALPTGVADLPALRGQARRVGPGYQLRLAEEARGTIVIGATTFLFQFVTPPPAQQRAQLPLSVKGGLASRIDWGLTIIAAFTFLVHFGLVGALYCDWTDPVVNDDITAGVIEMMQRTVPLPADTQPTSTAAATETAPVSAQTSTRRPTPTPPQPREQPPGTAIVRDLVNEAERIRIATVAALNSDGPALASALRSNDEGAAANLNDLATKTAGIDNSTGIKLNTSGSTGPFQPGKGCVGLQCVRVAESLAVASTAGTATAVVPQFSMPYQPPAITLPVADAEAVIRSQIHPGAKRCYQRGLESDPTQAGRLVILIKVSPSGEVDSASVVGNSGLSAQVASCIALVARRVRFDPPGSNGSSITVPFSFVRQGG